ncbi:MAG: hypothetical protein COU90_03850 [Candidatus Ryanbacteria bacterium CG10_big_fil_rev_8_21_14_0_10_43_42]|uniref:Uncharacterized protein n=1 Tax=Candidatus Ryanbacteria bacterium CG10_big_fil_rev_8_21_14_0_10_43_42 TaxID=1974864 RepID=A0A2M8KW95_9BACT|nr:MAG: hypothetical protein COU90_03850 [Candidatus Ryanbacteria bacterium CG10_big_fil_rev_8_21_14_0_10_43_42]
MASDAIAQISIEQSDTEQESRADLLRARTADKRREKNTEKNQEIKTGTQKPFPISPVESGIGMMIGLCVDAFEALGALTAVIPVIGWAIAGASAVVGAVFSGIMFLGIALWFLFKGICPDNPHNITLYTVLFATTFSNTVFNWLPAWFGFFFWLFYRFYKKKIIPFSFESKK